MNIRISNCVSVARSYAPTIVSSIALACASFGCASSAEPPKTQSALSEGARCAGYDKDPAVGEALGRSSVESVDPIYASVGGRNPHTMLTGATIRVRPVRGVTAEWLGRVLECRRFELAGAGAAGQDSDPFFVPGSTVKVDSAEDGFRIEVAGTTAAEGHEILSRALAFAGRTEAPSGNPGL